MNEYKTTNGKRLIVYEFSFSGMAGEPMTVLHARWTESKRQIPMRKALALLSEHDRREVQAWIAELSMYNESSAIAWTI